MTTNRKIISFSVFIFTTLLAMGTMSASSADKDGKKMEMKRLLPLKVGSYQSDGKDESYDRNTTFRYMDGAAELYRSYAFKLLMVRRYLKAGQPPIIVEVFDMGSSEDAFGVFSYEAQDEEVGVGQGSDYGGGLLRVWKGKYFFNVYAEQEAPSIKQDLLEMGKAIAKSIKIEGHKPKLMNDLPKEGLIERSIRYFHLSHHLNHHYFLSHENILRLGAQTNAVLASYSSPTEGKFFLLLIQYSTQKLAKEALQSFVKAYMPDSSSGVIKTENGRWAVSRVHQKYLIVSFDAPLQERGETLIQATIKNLEERK
jgi:hypothetical protein